MKFICDHDIHIHSKLSGCSNDPMQTVERMLEYAKENGLKTICVTDHYWEKGIDNGPMRQDYSWNSQNLPLPQSDGIKFMFGCETDLNRFGALGIKETLDKFDFIIIPTTHLHLEGFTVEKNEDQSPAHRADLWVKRLEHVLNMDLPFRKIGIAHMVAGKIVKGKENLLQTLDLIPDETYERIFKKIATLGCGIEINYSDMRLECTKEERDRLLRPYKLAKNCGCKFYFGSDAHHPEVFEHTLAMYKKVVEELNLTEDDKFHMAKAEN
ncbi:MAG: PHP domain-containing protein [Ruminococcaceae bacterium]|nr:PHP domain-containing protein [Oscillospiraceae bacterium]